MAYDIIKECMQKEMTPNGMLYDVNTLITTSTTKDHIETPSVWIERKGIVPINSSDFGKHMILQLPISFVCCAEDTGDVEIEEIESFSLACRCISTILKNIIPYLTNDGIGTKKVNISNMSLDRIEPTGQFEIINKSTILPASRVNLTFTIDVDWMSYEKSDVEHTKVNYCEDEIIDGLTFEDLDVR